MAEWFNFFGRQHGCPVVGIYPPRNLEQVHAADVDQVVAQFDRLISTGEQVTGKPLDRDRLWEVTRLSFEASGLWQEVLQTARRSPAPLTFFDGTILMAPIVVMRGTQGCVEFYRQTLGELQQLVDGGRGAVPDEGIRLYWEGMPIWGRLRWFSEICAENRAAVVASTYCNSWAFKENDPDNPLRSLATAYTEIFINRGEETKLAYVQKMLDLYRIDGVICHDAKTCFNNSNSRFGLPSRLQSASGVDTLIIDGDLNDLRFFSDGQSRTKLETFFEQLHMKMVAAQ